MEFENTIIQSQQGIRVADVGHNAMLELESQTLGNKFNITETSLSVKPDMTVSDDDMRLLIATLARHTGNAERLKTSFLWHLGDTCMILQEFSHDPDAIISEAVAATDRTYHTVRQAIKLSRHFPPDKRIPEWTATHHAEIMNYSGNFEGREDVLEGVISKARQGHRTVVVSKDGKAMETVEPVSAKELREMLRKAAGKNKEEKPDKPRFLYLDGDFGVTYSKEFVKPSAQEALKVIDLKQLAVVDDGGNMVEVIKPVKENVQKEK